jgi:phage terminase large subunit-like protein
LKCQHKSDGSFQIFLAKHLNIEIGLRLRNDRWTAVDFWEENAQAGITVDSLIERSDVICAGIDGGGLDDLLGFALVGRDKDTHEWLVWTHAWAHPSVLERRKSEESKFRDFAKDGDLTIVARVGDDVSEISALVSRVYESGLLDRVGVDQHGLGGILDALMSVDIPEEDVIGISQGWKMVSAIKATERKLAEGMIKHSGSKMMAWCMSNARIVPAGNAVMITKAVSGTAKIDPVIAMLNAATLMALNPSPKRSFWETLDN